jgi:hypothetical protein
MVSSLVHTLNAIAPGANHTLATVGQGLPAQELPIHLNGSSLIRLFDFSQKTCKESSCDSASSIEVFIRGLQPSQVILYGHCETTMIVALVCSKLHIRVAQVGAGERPREKQLPGYTNSVLMDQLADLLVAFSAAALDNLRKEGVPEERIYSMAVPLSNEISAHVIAGTEGIARALAVPKNFDRERPLSGDLAATAKARFEVIQQEF